MAIQDLLFMAMLLLLSSWLYFRDLKKKVWPVFFRWTSWVLLAYHLLFSLIFHHYIIHHGGDSVGYWNLTADASQGASSWMEYLGFGTFFIQWINYLPSRVMGLSYASGNLLYACISFLGFRKLMQLGYAAWGKHRKRPWSRSWVVILFLPNLHFWTAGVGKEALLWVGLVYALTFLQDLGRFRAGFLGILLSFAVRPLNGAILLLLLGSRLISSKSTQFPGKWVWVGLLVLLLGGATYRLLYQTHMPGLTVSALEEFSRGQFAFLEGFGAGSEFPMASYSWPRKLWTIAFLPLDLGNGRFWQVGAALENGLSLLLVGIAGISWIRFGKKVPFPAFLVYGMAVGILLSLAYALTLNNLGILMRMKSIYMLFFLLASWHVLSFPNKSHYCRHFGNVQS